VGDAADEGVDPVAGDEGAGGVQGLAELDLRGVESDLLPGLAQGGGGEVGVVVVTAAAGEGDLAGVAAQVGAALGENQAGLLGPAVEGQQDRGVGQTITCTVPPSTDQAAPLT
jgi:hypothetical protein